MEKSNSYKEKLKENLFYTSIIHCKEDILPSELNVNKNFIDNILLNKVKKRIGNKCYREGFIDMNSIKLLDRTIGEIKTAHFNGNIVYNLTLETKICKPLKKDIIKCTVIGKNKIGILAKQHPLVIVLPSVYHSELDTFNDIKKDDEISIEVICSKFEYGDSEINVIGKLFS